MYKKPTNFMELLELQKVLDDKTAAERPNGFKPRPRTERDIRFALDDEFNEFMKELPDELNFKTWKQKEWSAEKQLEEWGDCLFFIAALINDSKKELRKNFMHKIWRANWSDDWCLILGSLNSYELSEFKNTINQKNNEEILREFIQFSIRLKYQEDDILNAYWKKWNKNMGRPEKDWTL